MCTFHPPSAHASRILRDIKGIAIVQFDNDDIVRHRLVKEIVNAYNKETNNNNR